MLLRQIKYFQSVVENGNFYLAAEKCCISQSAISQQIKKLEDELGVQLLIRHNRTFSLTDAGKHFYHKSLAITDDIDKLVIETKHIAHNDNAVLRLGYYKDYYGNELAKAVEEFSQKYPNVNIEIISGSHEELYNRLENESVDIVLNDQRRAFSGAYNNVVLCESKTYIEISSKSKFAEYNEIDIDDLRDISCILVANDSVKDEEMQYYKKLVGLKSNFIFVSSSQEARLKLASSRAYMPVDVIGEQEWFDTTISRVPLFRKNEPVTKTYCVFWKKDNSGYYIEEFSDILKEKF